ncbi:MAG: hypothetical protein MUO76_11455 [Anaerolineaceae bacterium]|nr:hypothetical protein [Anaerolineaceae bacterium]
MKSIFLKKTGEEGDELFRSYVETTDFLSNTQQWAPHLVEETRGLAEGANLPSYLVPMLLHGNKGRKLTRRLPEFFQQTSQNRV